MFASALMQMPAGIEWVLIVVAVVIVFFGVKKIPELARTFGKAGAEYEKAKLAAKKEVDDLKRQTGGPQ